jgi:starvation-inducible outer membrane lipoprotein
MFYKYTGVLVLGLVVGCSNVPHKLEVAQHQTLTSFESVNGSSIGEIVRWGGLIVDSTNQDGFAEILILQHPLDEEGKPEYHKKFGGKFVGRIGQDESFRRGALITLIGKIDGIEKITADGQSQHVALIQVDDFYVWQDTDEPSLSRSKQIVESVEFPKRGKWGWEVKSQKEKQRGRQERENERNAKTN